jgi:hypothetical protein
MFSTGAAHKLESGAVIQDVAALHVQIRHSNIAPSVSTQIAALRNILLDDEGDNMFSEVAKVLSCHLLLDCIDVDVRRRRGKYLWSCRFRTRISLPR